MPQQVKEANLSTKMQSAGCGTNRSSIELELDRDSLQRLGSAISKQADLIDLGDFLAFVGRTLASPRGGIIAAIELHSLRQTTPAAFQRNQSDASQ